MKAYVNTLDQTNYFLFQTMGVTPFKMLQNIIRNRRTSFVFRLDGS